MTYLTLLSVAPMLLLMRVPPVCLQIEENMKKKRNNKVLKAVSRKIFMRENHTTGMNSRIHFTQAEKCQTIVTSDASFLQSQEIVMSH